MRDLRMKQDILNRLKSIEGHLRGIQRMVEEDQYCIDVLNQTGAIRKALERVDVLILENHLESCVTTAIRGDDAGERERVIRELLMLFNQRSAISGQQSAISHQPPAASRQPPAISDHRATRDESTAACHTHGQREGQPLTADS